MKHIGSLALVILLLMALSACQSKTEPEGDTPAGSPSSPTAAEQPQGAEPPPAAPPVQEPDPVPPSEEPVSAEDITVAETPVSLTDRPQFLPGDRVAEEELISLHGYTIGMTFKETQQVWEIPKEMIDYGIGRWTAQSPILCIYVGNMYYDFRPRPDADINDFDDYTLWHIYYGESIFCTNREALSVLRDIKLGDTIGDALKSLPGNRTPRKWALDQLYGEHNMPDSASLEYITNLGFYDLRIFCQNSWIRLSFHSDGKLRIAEAYANEG